VIKKLKKRNDVPLLFFAESAKNLLTQLAAKPSKKNVFQ